MSMFLVLHTPSPHPIMLRQLQRIHSHSARCPLNQHFCPPDPPAYRMACRAVNPATGTALPARRKYCPALAPGMPPGQHVLTKCPGGTAENLISRIESGHIFPTASTVPARSLPRRTFFGLTNPPPSPHHDGASNPR
jgi:hypothetical protein